MRAREIFGRERELDELLACLDSVPDGPIACVLSGEAGIGKSALWERALEEATDRSQCILACRPAEPESTLSFAALDDLLEPVLAPLLPLLTEPKRRALEVALLRAGIDGADVDQRAVSRAVLDVVRWASDRAPVLLAIDDVQWLDPPSARVLEFVARRLGSQPVVIVATVRAGGNGAVPLGLDRALAHDRLCTTTVGPLNVAATQHLVSSRLGLSLPRHVLTRLHQQSGGNPLYALEIARSLLQTGVPPGPLDALPIPDDLVDLVGERLARLSPSARRVIPWVASMAQPTVTTLRAVAGDDAGTRPLSDAIEAGILELDGGRIRFTHPLLGSVAYGRVGDEERRRLHGALAAVVSDPEERGRHLALAAEAPDQVVAAVLDEGARHAAARGALDAAAALSEQAWRATPPECLDDRHRRALFAIDYHFGASEMARAAELAEEVLATCRTGRERASVLYRKAITRGRLGHYVDETGLLTEALTQAGGDLRLRSEIELELGMVATIGAGDLQGGRSHGRAALHWAERAGEPRLLVDALVWVAGHEFVGGGGIREDLFRRAQSIEETAGPWPGQQLALLDLEACWGMVMKWADHFEGARSKLESRLRRALDEGDESVPPLLLYHLAELACWSGDWRAAERLAVDAVATATDGEQPVMLPSALYSSALVDAHLGRIDTARATGEEALRLAESMRNVTVSIMARSVLGFVELSAGHNLEAVRHLAGLAPEMTAMAAWEPGIVRFPADAVEALLAVGEVQQAAEIAEDLEERGRRVDRPWALATGARSRGLVQAARGELEAALASLEQALVEHRRLAVPFELGRTYLVKGTIERRAKRKAAAKHSLALALHIFERLGAPLWAAKARAESDRTGLRPRAPLELTPTELRIAELVMAGKTSREVADALFISVKTVDSNLTRIYRKLGVRSRTELATKDLVAAWTQVDREQTRESP